MNDPHATPSPEARDAYRQGVLALLEGRFQDAERELAAAAEAGLPEAELARAKVHLERGEGAAAAACLAARLESPPAEPAQHGYLLLLDAFAAALDGRPDAARDRAAGAVAADPRFEAAARELRRRLDKGRPPRPGLGPP